ncbi:MAG: pyridoxine 5'-phosphate synthase [Acidobacteriota bacterium]
MKLCVNVDHIATLRQARKAKEPDPVLASLLAEISGADGIVIHLREDRRHIQERDLEILRKVVKTKLNLEMAATTEMIEIAAKYKPDISTLVPEKREELTTEGGLNVISNFKELKNAVDRLKKEGIEVSIFIDPDVEQIKKCGELGANTIEINTGKYSETETLEEREMELQKIKNAAKIGKEIGFKVVAGHGLDYKNVSPIVKIGEIEELNIGFSIIARSAIVGIEKAVREMKELIRRK